MVLNLDLKLLNQLSIWEMLLGTSITKSKKFKNPTRVDKDPSCSLINKDGILILYDHSLKQSLNCVTCYSMMYNMSYREAFEHLSSNNRICTKINYEEVIGDINEEKSLSYVKSKSISLKREYWEKRGVRLEQLEREETKTELVDHFVFTFPKKSITSYPLDICFAYSFHNGIKLYFPEREKPRFKSVGDKNSIWYLKRGSKDLLVCKSNKDFLGLENICDLDLMSIFSEGSVPNKLFEVSGDYENIYITNDPDEPGFKSVKKLQEMLPVKHLHTNYIDGLKDWDDYIIKNGLENTKSYFKNRINELNRKSKII